MAGRVTTRKAERESRRCGSGWCQAEGRPLDQPDPCHTRDCRRGLGPVRVDAFCPPGCGVGDREPLGLARRNHLDGRRRSSGDRAGQIRLARHIASRGLNHRNFVGVARVALGGGSGVARRGVVPRTATSGCALTPSRCQQPSVWSSPRVPPARCRGVMGGHCVGHRSLEATAMRCSGGVARAVQPWCLTVTPGKSSKPPGSDVTTVKS